MKDSHSRPPLERRSFLSRMGVGVAALGLAGASAPLSAQGAPAAPWQPRRHPEDDWYDLPKAGHRFVIDSTTPDGAGAAMLYANNYFIANKAGYRLEPNDLAIVIVLRHFSTPFAYNDSMWAKYGAAISEMLKFSDPKTKQAATINVYNSPAYGTSLPNFGTTVEALVKQNVQFAVCAMATRFFAGALAEQTHGDAERIYQELAANLIPNSHMVSAGIVAVNRAQEHGYSFAYAG